MKIEITNTKLGEIEYSIVGKGMPVLFMHGGHSNCREMLCYKGFDINKYQIIIPSRPGYGNTPLRDNTTPRKSAALVMSLLDFLEIDKVILYGISAGGLVSISIAANYPQRVEKLILASAVSKKWFNINDKLYKTAKKLFNPKIEGFIWGTIRTFSKIFPRMIANSFYPQFSSKETHKLKSNDIQELLSLFKDFNSKEGFMSDIDHSINDEVIGRVNCPTLVIHSVYDTSVLYTHAEHSYERIKNAELVRLENEWGHLFWLGNDSNESIKKIIEFIEQ